MEIWKTIPWYEKYEVSDKWNIRSLNYNWTWSIKILCKNKHKTWYGYIWIFNNGKRKTLYIHRLVLLAFKWPSKLHCNHKNWIKEDNRLENLEYCTSSENNLHKFRELWYKNHLHTNHPKTRLWKFWKDNPSSKRITQFTMEWDKIETFDSLSEAGKATSIHISSISLCCLWKWKTAGGYKWQYT